MIGWEYPPKNSGGLGVACQGIVEHLIDAGQELILVLPHDMSPSVNTVMFTTPRGNTYPVIFVLAKIKPYTESLPERYRGNLIDDVYCFSSDVLKAVAKEKFDVIHVHDWLTLPAGLALKNKFNKPLVVHVHSTEYDRTAGRSTNFDVENIEMEGFSGADKVVAVSGYTKSILIDKYRVPENKIYVVHNGIDYVEEMIPGEDFLGTAPVILFVGRLTIQKGPEYFIRLAEQVISKRPDAIFVIVGDGDMYKEMIEYSAFRELSGSVLFAGFLRGVSKQRLFKRANVFVMPSVSEPFGLVALEAAVEGVPIIISKTSGVAEVLPSAIKVDFWDTDLAAKKVLEIIGDSSMQKGIGAAVRTESLLLSWDKAANELKSIYKKLQK